MADETPPANSDLRDRIARRIHQTVRIRPKRTALDLLNAGHSVGMSGTEADAAADAALAVRDDELERWHDVAAATQRRADRLRAERDVLWSAIEQAREIAEKNPDNRLSPRILIALTAPTGDVHTHAQRVLEGGE